MSNITQPNTLKRFDAAQGPRIIGPQGGKLADFGSFGVRFMIWGAESGGGFSLVEHPIAPHALVAPLHRHIHEDEYSYVLDGRMGAQLGEEVVYAEVGDLVFKPRNQWHTFWNAGDTPCRILEIISPAGFEGMFDEIATNLEHLTPEVVQDMYTRYGFEADNDSVARLCAQHGLIFGNG
ncbi:MAG: cupin domain-containing protein [Armatimonadetes bacterium]|nr:cupin domain-containing protein [Anaerolineae bacterium]